MKIWNERFREVFVLHRKPRRVCVGFGNYLTRRSSILVHQLEPDVSVFTSAKGIDISQIPIVDTETIFHEGVSEKNLRKHPTTRFWNRPPIFGRKTCADMPDSSFMLGKQPRKMGRK
mgnify:CR=1 FL=1